MLLVCIALLSITKLSLQHNMNVKSYSRSDDTIGLDTHYKPKSNLMTAAYNIVLATNKSPWVIVAVISYILLPMSDWKVMHISLTTTLNMTYDVDLQSLRTVVMTYSVAKLQGQRSVGYEHRAANNRTQVTALGLPVALVLSVKMCRVVYNTRK